MIFVGPMYHSLFRSLGTAFKAIGLGPFDASPRPVMLGALGGLLVSVIGVLAPPTMFWSESETGVIADPELPLPHVWPPVRSQMHDIESSTPNSDRRGCALSQRLSMPRVLIAEPAKSSCT